MQRNTRIWIGGSAAVVVLLSAWMWLGSAGKLPCLVGCGKSPHPEDYFIGRLGAGTAEGTTVGNSILMAVEELNLQGTMRGRKLRLVSADEGPAEGAGERGFSALIGEAGADGGQGARLGREREIPVVLIGGPGVAGATGADAGRNVFHIAPDTSVGGAGPTSPQADSAPPMRGFVASYEKRFGGQKPDARAALAYDAMYLLAHAITLAATDDPRVIRDSLAAVRDYPGVTGILSFDLNRVAFPRSSTPGTAPGAQPGTRMDGAGMDTGVGIGVDPAGRDLPGTLDTATAPTE